MTASWQGPPTGMRGGAGSALSLHRGGVGDVACRVVGRGRRRLLAAARLHGRQEPAGKVCAIMTTLALNAMRRCARVARMTKTVLPTHPTQPAPPHHPPWLCMVHPLNPHLAAPHWPPCRPILQPLPRRRTKPDRHDRREQHHHRRDRRRCKRQRPVHSRHLHPTDRAAGGRAPGWVHVPGRGHRVRAPQP